MNKKSTNIIFFIVFLIYFIVFGNCVLAVQVIEHHDPEFSISIPDNFKAIPANLMPENWLYGFKERTGMRDEPQITIGVEKVESVIKDKDQRMAALKVNFSSAGAKVEEMVFNVPEAEFNGIRVINSVGAVKSIMLIVQLPAGRQFVRIITGGNIEREQEINQLFKDILMSFRAQNSLFSRYSMLMAATFFVLTVLFIISRVMCKEK